MTISVLLADDQPPTTSRWSAVACAPSSRTSPTSRWWPAGRTTSADAGRPLSERETEVVREIARGRTNLEIAAEMFISLSTVKGHVAAVQAKLGLRNRVEVAAWAWETGLVGG